MTALNDSHFNHTYTHADTHTYTHIYMPTWGPSLSSPEGESFWLKGKIFLENSLYFWRPDWHLLVTCWSPHAAVKLHRPPRNFITLSTKGFESSVWFSQSQTLQFRSTLEKMNGIFSSLTLNMSCLLPRPLLVCRVMWLHPLVQLDKFTNTHTQISCQF